MFSFFGRTVSKFRYFLYFRINVKTKIINAVNYFIHFMYFVLLLFAIRYMVINIILVKFNFIEIKFLTVYIFSFDKIK